MGRIIRQVWPGTWEHRIKCFWGRILSQINLKGQDGRACDVCRAGIGKPVLIWQGRPLLAATLNSASWSLSRASKPACAALRTENREERGGRVLCKAHKKSKRCGRRPNHNLRPSVRSRFSARQINYKLAGKSEYSDWPFAGEKLKAWEERGHFMGPSHREHSSVTRIFIAPDCRSKS